MGKEKKKGDFFKVLITMPYFQMKKDGKRVIKYLNVEDFNALMASKLEDWENYAKLQFNDHTTFTPYTFKKSFFDLVMQVSKEPICFLPRAKDQHFLCLEKHEVQPLLVLNYDKDNLGSQACLVRNSRLESRYYVRLEGYSLILLDNDRNILASLLLDLEDG